MGFPPKAFTVSAPALEIYTKKCRTKVAPTLKNWGPHLKVGGKFRSPVTAKCKNLASFIHFSLKLKSVGDIANTRSTSEIGLNISIL